MAKKKKIYRPDGLGLLVPSEARALLKGQRVSKFHKTRSLKW